MNNIKATIDNKETTLEYVIGYRISNRYAWGLFKYNGIQCIVGCSDTLKKEYSWFDALDGKPDKPDTIEGFEIKLTDMAGGKLQKPISLANFQARAIIVDKKTGKEHYVEPATVFGAPGDIYE